MALTPRQDYLQSQPLVSCHGGHRRRRPGQPTVGSGQADARSWSATPACRKYRNVARTGRAALVVDDLVSHPGRCVASRCGAAPGGHHRVAGVPGASADVIVLHPDTVFTWGIEPGASGTTRRDQAS
jgi:pyridoxamine 5'-phosphate oxidase family protein